MIEVFLVDDLWTWHMISQPTPEHPKGRVLAYHSGRGWVREMDAFAAAKNYRTLFWAYACTVDHRMAACI